MLVDHHCHLDVAEFDATRDAIVARAAAAGVGILVSISMRIRRFDNLLAIAERYPNVYCTVGTHPHCAHEELDVPVSEIVRLSAHPKVVGIGEAGLDYYYDNSPREAQAQGFRSHIAAARETGLPLVIHTRDADDATIAILEEEMAKGPFKAVLHCYTGGAELARRGVEMGLYVSFSGVLTFKGADGLRGIAADVPLDRILVETDAPYLAPVPMRGKTNEPAFVVHTAAALAKVKGLAANDIARITTENFHRLYAKVPRETTGGKSGTVAA